MIERDNARAWRSGTTEPASMSILTADIQIKHCSLTHGCLFKDKGFTAMILFVNSVAFRSSSCYSASVALLPSRRSPHRYLSLLHCIPLVVSSSQAPLVMHKCGSVRFIGGNILNSELDGTAGTTNLAHVSIATSFHSNAASFSIVRGWGFHLVDRRHTCVYFFIGLSIFGLFSHLCIWDEIVNPHRLQCTTVLPPLLETAN